MSLRGVNVLNQNEKQKRQMKFKFRWKVSPYRRDKRTGPITAIKRSDYAQYAFDEIERAFNKEKH
jgi:hypothetical protein